MQNNVMRSKYSCYLYGNAELRVRLYHPIPYKANSIRKQIFSNQWHIYNITNVSFITDLTFVRNI